MTALTINYRCRCGNHVDLINHSRPTPTEQSLIVHCTTCDKDTQLLLRALPVESSGTANDNLCGSNAGYRRHHRNHEPACDGCKDAHAAYEYELRRKRKANQ